MKRQVPIEYSWVRGVGKQGRNVLLKMAERVERG